MLRASTLARMCPLGPTVRLLSRSSTLPSSSAVQIDTLASGEFAPDQDRFPDMRDIGAKTLDHLLRENRLHGFCGRNAKRGRGAVWCSRYAARRHGFTFLSANPFPHWHPCLSEPRGVAAEFSSHASAPIATHSQRMLRYSFRSLSLSVPVKKRTGYSPSRYRGRCPRPRACPVDSQSGTVSCFACIGRHSFCGQSRLPVFNCRTGVVVLSDTTALDISYAAFPAAIL